MEVQIILEDVHLGGFLELPANAESVVVFAHGSGSTRFSPRNNYVASVLRQEGLGTLLFDLLTHQEDLAYKTRFNIDLLAARLSAATLWLLSRPDSSGVSVGYFGASTGAAAALQASTTISNVNAIVSRGGRPDLAWDYLEKVKAPTLLIVGGKDEEVLQLNQQALAQLKVDRDLVVVPGATHLFDEPGALEEVARNAARWFRRFLRQ